MAFLVLDLEKLLLKNRLQVLQVLKIHKNENYNENIVFCCIAVNRNNLYLQLSQINTVDSSHHSCDCRSDFPYPFKGTKTKKTTSKKLESKKLKNNPMRIHPKCKLDDGIPIKPVWIKPEDYLPYFINYHFRDFIFPAIDPIFLKLLNEDNLFWGTIALKYDLDKDNYPPKPTFVFQTEERNPFELCLSPNKIIWYFLQNKGRLSGNNFFLLKVKANIRIVNIEFLENIDGVNKYFLYLYSYHHWNILERNLKGKTASFITEFFI